MIKRMVEIEMKLMKTRMMLIVKRNEHVDKIFFIYRKSLQRKVEEIDRSIAVLDREINFLQQLMMNEKPLPISEQRFDVMVHDVT